MTSTAASAALASYRIPLFLLPIYQAAGDEYGIPWQILAGINEIETNYGSDLAVSSAGAVGWMQFMPATWAQYGVDATGSGFADPYNAADAIFSAARYLRAAGAQTNLRQAIFAYNHSNDYVNSVLLRARLIDSYPQPMIDALTGLSLGRPPVTAVSTSLVRMRTPASATGPAAAGARRRHAVHFSPAADIRTRANANVVAIKAGTVLSTGRSAALGGYLTLRDADGNVFTYGHLARVALRRHVVVAAPSPSAIPVDPSIVAAAADIGVSPLAVAPAPPASVPGNASRTGRWTPLRSGDVLSAGSVLGQVANRGRAGVLRFAIRPAGARTTVDARAFLQSWKLREQTLRPRTAAAVAAATSVTGTAANTAAGLSPASPDALNATSGGAAAVAPQSAAAGSPGSAAPTAPAQPVLPTSDLASWGDKRMFLQTRAQLERVVLADRRIRLPSCARHSIADNLVDRRVLAVLEYLAQSGLDPRVAHMRCVLKVNRATGRVSAHASSGVLAHSPSRTSGPVFAGGSGSEAQIAAINGIPLAGHPLITELALARLLPLRGDFTSSKTESLIAYPEATNSRATADRANRLRVSFSSGTAAKPAPAVPASTGLPVAPTAVAAAVAATPGAAPASGTLPWPRMVLRLDELGNPALYSYPSTAAFPVAQPTVAAARRHGVFPTG